MNQDDAGGGGGALGRIRVNAAAPSVDGLMSPTQTSGGLTIGSLPVTSG
ncbi:MAG: hypothetical protein JRI68_24020 [Deltaproteobacteria bacterium]|nr:hypothetical protein [Deltaproteobacteria bacterium]